MILIYSPQITPRLEYIAKLLFTSILGIPVAITSNPEEYKSSVFPKINYSSENADGVTIYPHSLLFEKGINNIDVQVSSYKNIPTLFPISKESSLPFDPFASAFYMTSRYEEYLNLPVDQHHRTIPNHTTAYRHNFLEIPVVDHWALMLRDCITENYPKIRLPERQYRFIPTIDIDVAFAYRYRSVLRTAAASVKSFINQNWKDNQRRFRTLLLNQPDPYDTFSLLNNWHKQHGLSPVFFFLVGNYGRYDKNLSAAHPGIKRMIQNISCTYATGIHPSYQSNQSAQQLQKEIETLKKITGSDVTRSRQHFLMLRFPQTYQQLIKQGITEDYTMGFAQLPGFRAGICTPFLFYDLLQERETDLTIYPFQLMDGTLNQYLKLTPLEAINRISRLNDEVRKVNGTFISLWHNESLSEMRHWKNWREVYEALINMAS